MPIALQKEPHNSTTVIAANVTRQETTIPLSWRRPPTRRKPFSATTKHSGKRSSFFVRACSAPLGRVLTGYISIWRGGGLHLSAGCCLVFVVLEKLANYHRRLSFRMTEEASAPSTSADKKESIDVDGEAKRLLGLGQKNLVMGDIPSAVNAFQEAASLLGKKYGETANECAEAFFFYGKSLLELARMENGVLGNALEGVQGEEEEEKTEDSVVECADNIDETEGSEEDDKTEEEKENSTAEKESEDEIGNLELAWDMLELAKVIYKRQDTKEAQLHAAQAHLKLGEVSIESENYLQAIEEFHSCLALQQKYLEAHDRLLAETHYHLGLAYHYNNQYEEAVLQFGKSMEVIEKRMVMLTERLKAKGEGPTEDEKEIEELKGLLPEIKEKIEDSKESQKSARVTELALKATLVGGSSSFSQGCESSATSTIPVGQAIDGATDISHLVRKKRKPEEETQQGDNEAKKSKSEPAVNGGDAAPSGNEVAEKMEQETGGRPQVETVQSAV